MELKVAPPLTLVIFGASGDLTRRKLLPSLYDLWADGLLNPSTEILGVARRVKSHQEFRDEISDGIRSYARTGAKDDDKFHHFLSRVFYQAGDFEDPSTFDTLRATLQDEERTRRTGGNVIFYLATPPSYFVSIIREIGDHALSGDPGGRDGDVPFTRIVIEKPFGRDLASARDLNRELLSVFREEQVYRIDHYLGKETVQNILVFRLANPIFGALWSNIHVNRVEIRVMESLGMEGRGGYFEEAGIIRDMIQSHLLQVMTLTAMDPPVAFESEAIRDEKVKVLRSLKPYTKEEISQNILRGQYVQGVLDGLPVPGYREEAKVSPGSRVETFAAMRVEIQNWRWAGVPFFLVAGKRLSKKSTEITLFFRAHPFAIFRLSHCDDNIPNALTIRIQPNEGVSIRFGLKRPSSGLHIDPAEMDFSYQEVYQGHPPDAYERLLHDAMVGDSTLFARNDEVERAWAYITPFLADPASAPAPTFYEAGSDGPQELSAFLNRS
jgi:glucose-6-phosphate 1-dehydrogenase|uniref:Glucose-6-phosphate 1-dehydrogenase n=1 Tax=Leptospirillum ferriphilum TaxID=178606 RepID=A0A7C3R021_9BACT